MFRRAKKSIQSAARSVFDRQCYLAEALERRVLLGSHTVGDGVWLDANGNGIQDAGEGGVAGVVVQLYSTGNTTIGDSDDVLQGTAVTDASGNYSITAALPDGGNDYLVFRAPVGYAFTSQYAGSDRTTDSDPNASGVTGLFTLNAGQNDLTLDAGLVGAAPGFGWAMGVGSVGNEWGNAVAADSAGNAYVTGTFQGTVDFDPGPGAYNLTSAGNYDIFVAKYSPAGALVWARAMGGASNDYGQGIAVGADGSVYTTGYFEGTADFDPGSATYNLTSAGSGDIFVSKLDASGNFVWARAMGGTSGDFGGGIAVGADGGVYTTGYFQGTADFDPGSATYNLTSAGGTDVFISNLDASGNFVWARAMGGTSNDRGYGIAVGADGGVYTTGYFQGTADFDPGSATYNLTSAGSIDIFVSKLNTSGNFLWAKAMGGTSTDIAYAIALASDGSVYTTGYFYGTADFDPGSSTYYLSSAGSADVFVSKLDTFGNFVWARRMGGSAYDDIGNAITVGAGWERVHHRAVRRYGQLRPRQRHVQPDQRRQLRHLRLQAQRLGQLRLGSRHGRNEF